MPREIYPSSYECDCGHQSHFFENTIREAKALSLKKKVLLCDSASQEHITVFSVGKMTDVICSKRGPKEHKTVDSKSGKRRIVE